MNTYRIAVLPGDGIGPEVTAEAIKSLEAASRGFRLELEHFSVGAGEYLRSGDPLPPAVFSRLEGFEAILLGAMGLPDVRWPDGTEMAPQLDLRERLELYAGLRPLRLYHGDFTPLKGRAAGAIDLLIVRENTEGLFSTRKAPLEASESSVLDGLRVSRHGAERLFRAAFEQARRRRRKVSLVDKANVLQSFAFFRRIFDEIAAQFADVEAEHVYVDAAALYLVQRPERFDVLVTENMFGDILSDLGAAVVGGMGLAPSADVGERHAVFQPSHGSAPDIAGRGVANPVATILSAAMMLEWLGETVAAKQIEQAVETVLAEPANRTPDLGGSLSTAELGDRIAARIA